MEQGPRPSAHQQTVVDTIASLAGSNRPAQPFGLRLEDKAFAKMLRSNATKHERVLWKVLNSPTAGIGARFTRQWRMSGYIIDFYCPSLKIAVEVDGGYHNSRHTYDDHRTTELLASGVKILLRFTNDQIQHELPQVVETMRVVVKRRQKAWC